MKRFSNQYMYTYNLLLELKILMYLASNLKGFYYHHNYGERINQGSIILIGIRDIII